MIFNELILGKDSKSNEKSRNVLCPAMLSSMSRSIVVIPVIFKKNVISSDLHID